MPIYPGILTIDSSLTESVYVTKTGTGDFSWNGDDVGEIDNIANRVSCTAQVKLYYCISEFYFILEPYSILTHCIEILKEIFDIPRKLYNVCKYKGKMSLMFLCQADNEKPIKVTNYSLTDTERIIVIFHWIIGVKGKYWLYQDNTDSIVFSRGPYKKDYQKTDLTNAAARKIFKTIKIKRMLSDIFISDDKRELLKLFMVDNLRSWYIEIIKRLDMLDCKYSDL